MHAVVPTGSVMLDVAGLDVVTGVAGLLLAVFVVAVTAAAVLDLISSPLSTAAEIASCFNFAFFFCFLLLRFSLALFNAMAASCVDVVSSASRLIRCFVCVCVLSSVSDATSASISSSLSYSPRLRRLPVSVRSIRADDADV